MDVHIYNIKICAVFIEKMINMISWYKKKSFGELYRTDGNSIYQSTYRAQMGNDSNVLTKTLFQILYVRFVISKY